MKKCCFLLILIWLILPGAAGADSGADSGGETGLRLEPYIENGEYVGFPPAAYPEVRITPEDISDFIDLDAAHPPVVIRFHRPEETWVTGFSLNTASCWSRDGLEGYSYYIYHKAFLIEENIPDYDESKLAVNPNTGLTMYTDCRAFDFGMGFAVVDLTGPLDAPLLLGIELFDGSDGVTEETLQQLLESEALRIMETLGVHSAETSWSKGAFQSVTLSDDFQRGLRVNTETMMLLSVDMDWVATLQALYPFDESYEWIGLSIVESIEESDADAKQLESGIPYWQSDADAVYFQMDGIILCVETLGVPPETLPLLLQELYALFQVTDVG